jgi:hypothetical protein
MPHLTGSNGLLETLGVRKARKKARGSDARRPDALSRARVLALPMIEAMNDQDRTQEEIDKVGARHGALPSFKPLLSRQLQKEIDANELEGVKTARHLLTSWTHAKVQAWLDKVEVAGAAYWLSDDGTVVLEPRLLAGPPAALWALAIAQVRNELQAVGLDMARCIKRCANPTCKKWFFDAGERGTRKWCCVPCGNAHRQIKLSETYEDRMREYEERRHPCTREGCEG